jgi:hypothetical protein
LACSKRADQLGTIGIIAGVGFLTLAPLGTIVLVISGLAREYRSQVTLEALSLNKASTTQTPAENALQLLVPKTQI